MNTVLAREKEHFDWADILKGLGILSVVWGHAGSRVSFYMFWFHMPLFFWLSGFLYRYKPDSNGIEYAKRKAKHLLVPYFFYLGLLTILVLVFNFWKGYPEADFWSENWKALLLGGSLLEGIYATFWFPTVLLFVQVAYDFLCRKLTSPFLRGLVILACFFLAYWESRYRPNSFVPWNLDVGLYAIVFYALGHLMRQKKILAGLRSRRWVMAISWLAALGFIYLYAHHIVDYGLDMKHRQYYYFGLNLILPVVFTLILAQLSMLLRRIPGLKQGLSYVGKAAMVIMYLHLGSVSLARHFFAITPLRFFIVGTLAPLFFYQLIQYIPYGRYFALGENLKIKPAEFCNVPNKSV